MSMHVRELVDRRRCSRPLADSPASSTSRHDSITGPPLHRLAGELLVVARGRRRRRPSTSRARDDLVRVDDDADEAVVASASPSCSTGRQACAAIATAISSVTSRPRAPVNSLSARNSVAMSRSAVQVARRCARRRNGKRASVSCQSASGIARRSQRARRAPALPASRSRRRVDAGASRRDAGEAGRASSAAPRRAACRAVEVPVAQHVAHDAGRQRRGSPARWVWPWISVGVPAPRIQRAARRRRRRRPSRRGSRGSRRVAGVAHRARDRAPLRPAAARRNARCHAGAAHHARESAGSRRRRGTARRRARAARAAPKATSTRRVGQRASRRSRSSSASPTQEVAVADHEGDRALRARPRASTSAQRASKPRSARVVADPDLEQVAEDEHRIGAACARRCAAQASKVRGVLASRCRSEMKSIARQPRRRDERRIAQGQREAGGAVRCHAVGSGHDGGAAMIVTSSSGTSSWPPLLPVRTCSIASTTSVPSTTLPNTA